MNLELQTVQDPSWQCFRDCIVLFLLVLVIALVICPYVFLSLSRPCHPDPVSVLIPVPFPVFILLFVSSCSVSLYLVILFVFVGRHVMVCVSPTPHHLASAYISETTRVLCNTPTSPFTFTACLQPSSRIPPRQVIVQDSPLRPCPGHLSCSCSILLHLVTLSLVLSQIQALPTCEGCHDKMRALTSPACPRGRPRCPRPVVELDGGSPLGDGLPC